MGIATLGVGPDAVSAGLDVAAEARGIGALMLLLLLPGLLVVRAHWTTVPFLSLSFWLSSWWWLGVLDVGRRRFLLAALAGFATLAALRLLKPWPGRWPSAPVWIVVVAAALSLLPCVLSPVAPDPGGSVDAVSTLLMVWRDGLPVSYQPLLPFAGFGSSRPGLPGLAADLGLLSGLPAYRSSFLVAAASRGLLAVAVFGLLAGLVARAVAVTAAVAVAAGAASLPAGLALGMGPQALALALLASAAAVLAFRSDRHRALAAGALFGASALADAGTALAAIALLPIVAVLRRGGRGGTDEGSGQTVRSPPWWRLDLVGWAFAGALAVAGPFLWRLRSVLASPAVRGAPGGTVGAGVAAFLCLGIVVVVALLASGQAPATRRPAGLVVLLAVFALGLGTAYHGAAPGERVRVGPDDLAAMAWIAGHTRPRDLVCNDDGGAGVFVPALTGRAVTRPPLPALFVDGRLEGPSPSCRWTYDSTRPVGRPGPAPAGRVVFQSGEVKILDSDTDGGDRIHE